MSPCHTEPLGEVSCNTESSLDLPLESLSLQSFLQSLHKEQWQEVRLGEVAEINPKESLKKHCLYKKVSMDSLEPYTKKIYSFSIESFSGGAKFRSGDTLFARITPLHIRKPNNMLILEFNKQAKMYFEKISHNTKQIQNLQAMRDVLLKAIFA